MANYEFELMESFCSKLEIKKTLSKHEKQSTVYEKE